MLQLFAQVNPPLPDANTAQLGTLALEVLIVGMAVGGAVTIAVGIKSLFTKSERNTAATHADVAGVKASLESTMAAMKNELSLKMDSLASKETVAAMGARLLATEDGHKELKQYTSAAIHELRGTLQAIALGVTELKTLLLRQPVYDDIRPILQPQQPPKQPGA
jgi:hypothetical protein